MKKKTISVLSVLLVAVLLSSTAFAGSVKLSGFTLSLDWLNVSGTLSGLGNTDVTVVLDAMGLPDVTCINQGGNQVTGQNLPQLSTAAQQSLASDDTLSKNGKSAFGVQIDELPPLAWDEAGCPNSNWTAQIDFIYWTEARITVVDLATQAVLLQQDYTCVTTRNPASISCAPVP